MELAGILNALGSDVSILIRHAFMRPFDEMLSSSLAEEMVNAGIKIHTSCQVHCLSKVPNTLLYSPCAGGGTSRASGLLLPSPPPPPPPLR